MKNLLLMPKRIFIIVVVALVLAVGCHEDQSISKETLSIEQLRSVVTVDMAKPHVDALVHNLNVRHFLNESDATALRKLERLVVENTDPTAIRSLLEFYERINYRLDFLSYSTTIGEQLISHYIFNKEDLTQVLAERVEQYFQLLEKNHSNGRGKVEDPNGPNQPVPYSVFCHVTCDNAADAEYDPKIEAETSESGKTIIMGQKAAFYSGCFECCTGTINCTPA